MALQHVFTYGSLMFEPVWVGVVAGRYRSMPAVLQGYRRQRVRGQDYPSLQRLPDGEGRAADPVDGVLYLDVDEADLAALDAFEGADYRRILVPVTPGRAVRGKRTVPASTYLFIADRKDEPGPWDPQHFEREAIARFLREHPPARR
jgi:hypothetical protein